MAVDLSIDLSISVKCRTDGRESSLEAVISRRTCAQGGYYLFISYLCVYLNYTYYINILEDAYGC